MQCADTEAPIPSTIPLFLQAIRDGAASRHPLVKSDARGAIIVQLTGYEERGIKKADRYLCVAHHRLTKPTEGIWTFRQRRTTQSSPARSSRGISTRCPSRTIISRRGPTTACRRRLTGAHYEHWCIAWPSGSGTRGARCGFIGESCKHAHADCQARPASDDLAHSLRSRLCSCARARERQRILR